MPVEIIDGVVSWLENGSTKTAADLAAIDTADFKAAERELKQLWGSKLESNLRAINKYADEQLAPGVGELIRTGRTADGHSIGSDPAFLQRLLRPALKPRPDKVDGDVKAQIASIEKFMRTNRATYDRDDALQLRYRNLIDERIAQFGE